MDKMNYFVPTLIGTIDMANLKIFKINYKNSNFNWDHLYNLN